MPIRRLCRRCRDGPGHECARAVTDGIIRGFGSEVLEEFQEQVRGRRVLVIEDVVTSAGQIAISAGQLRELGASIGHALCVIDRQEGGAGALAGDGIRLHALLRREELDHA